MMKSELVTGKEDELRQLFTRLVHVMKEQGMTSDELIDMYEGESSSEWIPLGIFSTSLSPAESLSKYLREEFSLSFRGIAELLNRDERSVWTSYSRAKEKMPAPFADSLKKTVSVPVSIFADRRRSILENLVVYLVDKTGDTKYAIARKLNKTPSMIYTIYKRAMKK